MKTYRERYKKTGQEPVRGRNAASSTKNRTAIYAEILNQGGSTEDVSTQRYPW